MSGGWIESDKLAKLPPGQLSQNAKKRAYCFAQLANDIYPAQTGKNRGSASLVYNWIELLQNNSNKVLGISYAQVQTALGRAFGFNAALYKLDGAYDQCWVLSFEGTAVPDSPKNIVRSAQDWLLTNIPTTLDKYNMEEAFGGPLFDRLLNPRKAPSTQYDIADLVAQEAIKLRGSEFVILTGHSLGGGLAQYAALKNDVRAIVFNSAGIGSRYADTIHSDAHKTNICHLMTTPDRTAFTRLGQIATGYGMQAVGAAALTNPALMQQGMQIFGIGKELSKQPLPKIEALIDQMANDIVTTGSDRYSRHFGTNYILGVGGHGMDEVMRVLKM